MGLILSRQWQNGLNAIYTPIFRLMAEVVCLCNEILDEDLREYLDTHPIDSIEELREQASICNKCMQCQELVEGEIYLARVRRQRAAGQF
jgi:bacterioferritin-associated ferredoxin